MPKEFITSGYLDVKISAKVKRGFTPWKAWKKQWCEIKRLDNIENGLEIKLKNTSESNSSNCFVIPRDATICRTESRSKNYSFGIFAADRNHKPLAFLSGASESDSQLWMYSIRRLLSLNSHIPDDGFYVSIIDNDHSRIAGLTGLHGTLTTNIHEVLIRDPSTGDVRTSVSWHHLHQFHLAAINVPEDDKRIIIIHTSKHFHAGAGQLHLFCLQAPSLLNCLVSRGKIPRIRISSLPESRRLSRSEGDLRETDFSIPPNSPTSPSSYYRWHSGSTDSGVRVSMTSDDSSLMLKCKKAVSSISLGFVGLLVATPGGSEIDNESHNELLLENDELSDSIDFSPVMKRMIDDPRRESGVSIVSGVYEEIPDLPPPKEFRNCSDRKSLLHTYEDPVDIILGSTKKFTPPPLPPRRDFRLNSLSDEEADSGISPPATPSKKDSNNIFCNNMNPCTSQVESHYMVMTGKAESQGENIYMPMNNTKPMSVPLLEEENQYMVMSGKKSS